MSLRTRLALIMLAAAVPLVGGWLWVRDQARVASLDEALEDFALVHMQAGGRQRCEANPERFVVALGPRLPVDPGAAPDRRPRGPREMEERAWRPPPRKGKGKGKGKANGRFDNRPPRRDEFDRPRPRPRPPRLRGPIDPKQRTDMWAYDGKFTSANPAAPTLPDVLRKALGDSDTRAGMDWRDGDIEGRQVAVRMPWAEGPAAFVLVRRPFPPDADQSTRIHLWGAILLAAGLLLAMLVAIGPVLRRIRRLTDDVEKSALAQYDLDVDASGRDELADLGKAFNEAGTRVRSQMDDLADREKTLRAFVANTTHDVMIPLTVLQGHLVALRKRAGDDDSTETALLKSSLEESHYIGCLVQNLSTMAKLEAGQILINEHELDLVELCKRAVARHEPLARERNVIIDTVMPPEPVVTRGDVTLLEQAVSNVINNAVRYNRDGGRVIVVLEARLGTQHFCLRVFDDGPGVSEEELERITHRSFRGKEARTRRPSGSGLGLHITRDVVERHGWALTVGPGVEDIGLEVVFEGPLAPAS